MAKSDRLYKNSPKLARDEETGEMGIAKPNDETANDGDDGSSAEMGATPEAAKSHERRELHHKHVKEKLDLHHRHEMAHAAGHADKKAHEDEHKAMTERHHHEFVEMSKRHSKKA